MDSKDFIELQDSYKLIYSESKKDESPEKEEEDRKKDDDLFGSPNKKNGKNGDDDKNGKNGKKKAKRWWDDDGDGKGYEKGEVKEDMNKGYVVTAADKKGNTPAWQGYKAGAKKKDGSPLYRAADHLNKEHHEKDANGNTIPHTDLQEKQKDTPDQVKAVIAFDKARKGTDDATYDSEHGDKKQAKKERDYAKWQRDKGAEDAQKSGHPWEHAKGSTREKEGKKSEKHAHIKDNYEPLHSTAIQGYANEYQAVYEPWTTNEQKELVTKEVKALQKAAKTGKGKYVAKADKVAEETLSASGKFSAEEIDAIVEAERKLADRLHRKRKLYDRTVPKAMDYARREGEAAGHARYRMGQLSREMDKVKDKMNKEK